MITAQTRLYAVIGDPVSHSLSPVMLNRAFEAVGYDGVYLALRVENLGEAISGRSPATSSASACSP